jgi:2-keto-4-pentenoate hydratase
MNYPGYAIQAALVAELKEPIVSWKIGSTNIHAQELVGTTGPISAPLLASHCFKYPAKVAIDVLFMRALEVEFALSLGADLKANNAPHSRNAIMDALDTLHPVIEVSDSRYRDWTSVGAPSLITDNGNDGIFVLGPGTLIWWQMDLAQHTAAALFGFDLWPG